MSSLESIVPPLEDCQLIPEGSFAESAVGYQICNRGYNDEYATVVFRREEPEIPAPIFSEILIAIRKIEWIQQLYVDVSEDCFVVGIIGQKRGNTTTISMESQDQNPATAALRMWLEINKKTVRDSYAAEVVELEKLLEEIPAENVIDRAGLESRLNEAKRNIEKVK